MAISAKYFITDVNGNFIDWNQSVPGLSIIGKEAQITGAAGADIVFVQAGTSADLTALGGGNDKVYLTGNLADYTQSIDQDTGVYTFTRIAGLPVGQSEVVKVTVSNEDDLLYFADGHITLNAETDSRLYDGIGFQSLQTAWLTAGGTPASGPVERGTTTTASNPARVFVTDPAGVDLPALPQGGQRTTVSGAAGADSVYVKAGTYVDASDLGGGNDRIYLSGNLADYSQSIDQDTGVYTLTRTTSSGVETVKVTLSNEDDVLYFADGHIIINAETNPNLFDPDTGTFALLTAASLISGSTPVNVAELTTEQIQALSPEQVAALTPAQLGTTNASGNTVLQDLTPEQIAALTIAQLDALTPAQIASLSPAQIAALTPAQLASLDTAQIGALTPEQVTDAAGNATTQSITVNLTNVNEAPVVTTPIADSSTGIGLSMASINAAAAFSDPDVGAPAFNTLSYSLSGAPAGVTIDATTGVISGTPTVAGSHTLTVTASDGTNSVTDQFVLDVLNAPALSTTQNLDGVTNLDVTSALVISFNQAVSLNSTGTQHIKIFDDMGTAGWTARNTTTGETKQDVFDNDVDITMTNGVATAVTIGGVDYTSRFDLANSVKVVGNNLVINLLQATGSHASTAGATDSVAFDWDFGANYHVNLDAGVVTANGLGNTAITDSTTLNFTTVAPVDAAAGAASQKMDLTGASSSLSAGYTWHNAHVQDSTSPGLALDFSTGQHALYIQSDGANSRTSTMAGRVLLSGLGIDDVIYNDNSGNMALASTEGFQAGLYTGSIAANTLKRALNNSDSGLNQEIVFADFQSAHGSWTNITSLNGGDNTLENATHFNSNVVIFG